MGKIIAFYYGSSSSDVATICTPPGSTKIVDIIVLQNSPSDKPIYSSTVKSMVSAANNQNVKAFGYVDSEEQIFLHTHRCRDQRANQEAVVI